MGEGIAGCWGCEEGEDGKEEEAEDEGSGGREECGVLIEEIGNEGSWDEGKEGVGEGRHGQGMVRVGEGGGPAEGGVR